MDIDNEKVDLFKVFVEEVELELKDYNKDTKKLMELAFHAGFEDGFTLGYQTCETDREAHDARNEIPF